MERIDKIIASQRQYTRKDIKKLIATGSITVNGTTVRKPDEKVDVNSATIIVRGKELVFKRNVYLLLNKPVGYTSIIEGNRRDTVMDLIPDRLFREGIFPAGRLDRDASGMMIITDDGELAHNILSPNKKIRKIYEIVLDAPVTETMQRRFAEGIQIGSEHKAAELVITGTNTCRVSTRDGRYFQVKQMFEACGANVTELHRVCIGNLLLPDDMEAGDCRELTTEELELLLENN